MTNNPFRSLIFLLALCVVGLFVAAAAQAPQEDDLASPKLRITWDEFKKLYDAGNVVVIDVRAEDAYRAGHIPGSQSIPLDQIEKRASDLKKVKKPLVLYCA